jgi:hypothetical protein
MSASSSGSSTALRSHEGSKPSEDVPSTVTVTFRPLDLSAKLAMAGKALKIWSLVALNFNRTVPWRAVPAVPGVMAGTVTAPPG